MKVSYIMMQFPAPSETFAANDIKTLKKMGIEINVYSLKRNNINHLKLIKERLLEDLEICTPTIMDNIKGIIIGFRNKKKSKYIINHLRKWMDIKGVKDIQIFVKSIILLPRILYVYQEIEKQQPDIVHLFWGHYPSLLGGLILKYNPEIKLTMFLGAYDLAMKYRPGFLIAQNADHVFTHSYYNVQDLLGLGISEKKVEEIKKITNRIVTAGRLITSKEFDRVILLFAQLVKVNSSLTLHILGDGPEKNKLKELIKRLDLGKHIVLKGHIPHSELIIEMEKSEYFMFFSNKCSERLPNVVKEAMYTKNICFITSTPGIEELVENGKDGFVRGSNKIEEFIEIFINIMENSEIKKRISNNAHQTIVEKFNVEFSMKKYIDIWTSML